MLKDLAAWGCRPEDLASERIKMKINWSRKTRALIIFFFLPSICHFGEYWNMKIK
jgi:hypothetical protein